MSNPLGLSDRRLRAGMAGPICSIVSMAFSLSYAALIFSGPLADYLPFGMAATFIATAIGASAMTLRSSLPFALAAPDVSTSAMTAALISTFVGHLASEGLRENLLSASLILLSLNAALTGVLLCGLGLARFGRAIRFVPFPVIGGFLASAGYLISAGAIRLISDQPVNLAELAHFLDPTTAAKLAAGCSVAAVLYVGRLRFKGPLAQPALLIVCGACVYGGLALFGVPLSAAQDTGWMFRPPADAAFAPPWDLHQWQTFPWHLLPKLVADLAAVTFVAAVSILLNVAGLEVTSKREANLDQELTTIGLANLASAVFGGYVNAVPLSRSTLALKLDGDSRVPNICIAATSLIMLVVHPGFIGFIPKSVLGGMLLLLGIDLLNRWLVVSSRRMHFVEYLSLIVITLIILNFGFVAGILLGVVIGCVTFALGASRINVINFKFDGSQYHSSLDRRRYDFALLKEYGAEIQGVSLQGYLFFGSANQLYQYVKRLLSTHPRCKYLLLDFRLVAGVDSSSVFSFEQIKQTTEILGVRLTLVHLSRQTEAAFRSAGIISNNVSISADLDTAVEECEAAIIAAHGSRENEVGTLRTWLHEAFGGSGYEVALKQYCRRIEVASGDVVARQGAPSDSMHFIVEGRVGIFVSAGDERSVRVRSLGQYTTIGEMGLITGQARSATIRAEAPTVLYVLGVEAFERMKIDQPTLAQALLSYVIRVMAERLSVTSRSLSIQQRMSELAEVSEAIWQLER